MQVNAVRLESVWGSCLLCNLDILKQKQLIVPECICREYGHVRSCTGTLDCVTGNGTNSVRIQSLSCCHGGTHKISNPPSLCSFYWLKGMKSQFSSHAFVAIGTCAVLPGCHWPLICLVWNNGNLVVDTSVIVKWCAWIWSLWCHSLAGCMWTAKLTLQTKLHLL